jgi:hypothetical protein
LRQKAAKRQAAVRRKGLWQLPTGLLVQGISRGSNAMKKSLFIAAVAERATSAALMLAPSRVTNHL